MNAQAESAFLEFILYNNWANQQVFQACQNLSGEQLAARIPGAYGTIHETLRHLIKNEAHYLRLITGSSPQPLFKWEDLPPLDELTAYAWQVGEALVEMAERMRPTDPVVEEEDGKLYHYHALAVFIQLIDHGIEHRTNITTLINQGMQSPPEVDGWAYLNTHPERFGLKEG